MWRSRTLPAAERRREQQRDDGQEDDAAANEPRLNIRLIAAHRASHRSFCRVWTPPRLATWRRLPLHPCRPGVVWSQCSRGPGGAGDRENSMTSTIRSYRDLTLIGLTRNSLTPASRASITWGEVFLATANPLPPPLAVSMWRTPSERRTSFKRPRRCLLGSTMRKQSSERS